MTTQRSILMLSIGLALVYVWLRGGFIGTTAQAAQLPTMQPGWEKATFAMGCFWSAESDFDKLAGVKFTTSGYTGGRVSNPSYEQVARGSTGHVEAIEVAFDPAVVPYEEVLEYFWRHVDPFVAHRQFCDVGQQYRPEIFVHSDAQRAAAEASKKRVATRFNDPIVVPISNARTFYPADESHQDYYLKHPVQYRYYRWSCGRDARLQEIWGNAKSVPRVQGSAYMSVHRWDPQTDGELSEKALRRKLEAQGYSVTRYVYPPGTHFPEHTHGVDKIDAVVAGRFELIVAGDTNILGPGDWIAVPRGVPHTARSLARLRSSVSTL